MDVLDTLNPTALARQTITPLEEFVDPAVVINALTSKGVTPEWIIEHLITIAENSERETTKLAALREIRKIINELAERAGLLAKVTQTQTLDDGSILSAERVANVLGKHSTVSVPAHVIEPQFTEGRKDEIDNASKTEDDPKRRKQSEGSSQEGQEQERPIHKPSENQGEPPEESSPADSNNPSGDGGGGDEPGDNGKPIPPVPGSDNGNGGDDGTPTESPTESPTEPSAGETPGGTGTRSRTTDASDRAGDLNIHHPPPTGNEKLFPGVARVLSAGTGRPAVHKTG